MLESKLKQDESLRYTQVRMPMAGSLEHIKNEAEDIEWVNG